MASVHGHGKKGGSDDEVIYLGTAIRHHGPKRASVVGNSIATNAARGLSRDHNASTRADSLASAWSLPLTKMQYRPLLLPGLIAGPERLVDKPRSLRIWWTDWSRLAGHDLQMGESN